MVNTPYHYIHVRTCIYNAHKRQAQRPEYFTALKSAAAAQTIL